ncbi:MAG: acyl carrier protein [bacterium]
MNEITEKLKHIIANELDVNADINTIRDDVTLLEGGIGLDSVAIMEFISIIEEQFDFQFSDDELNMEPFQNLNTLSEFVASKLTTATA